MHYRLREPGAREHDPGEPAANQECETRHDSATGQRTRIDGGAPRDGATAGVILFVAVFAVSMLQLRLLRSED